MEKNQENLDEEAQESEESPGDEEELPIDDDKEVQLRLGL